VLLQACSRTPGRPWRNPGGKQREAERPQAPAADGNVGLSGWTHMAVPVGPRELGISVWVQMHPDVSVALFSLRSVPRPGGCVWWLGLTPSLGLPIQQRNLEHQQQPGGEQQCLQGRAKRSLCWGGLRWSSSLGKAGTLRRCCWSLRCPPCCCSRSPPARPHLQHADGGGSHQS